MNEQRQGLDVERVLGIIVARWRTVVSITVLAAMVAYGYVTFAATEVYEATTLVTYQVPDRSFNPTRGALPSSGVTREDIGTLVANADGQQIVAAAAKRVGMEPAELRRSVRVQAHGEASVVAFIGRADSPEAAAERANAWAEVFVSEYVEKARTALDAHVREREAAYQAARRIRQNPENPDFVPVNTALQALNEAKSVRTTWSDALSISNTANPPEEPIWPRPMLTLAAALLIGFGIGSGAALLTARVDGRLRQDDLDALPAPVLIRVPESMNAPRDLPLGPGDAEPLIADSFAALGARVMLDRSGDGAHVILVTSARSGEGKSSVAANLASALAQGGRRVVLVDADMRRPTQERVFPQLQQRPGLSQVLGRTAELEHALTLVAPNLAGIASGPRHAHASVLLASVALRQLLERLEQISEVIIIDAPPVLAVNDALAIAPSAAQVLLVARVNASDTGEVREAHQRIASAASTPQAMVLVGTERPEGYGYDSELRALGIGGPTGGSQPPVAYPQVPAGIPAGQGGQQPGSSSGAVA